MRAGMLGRLRAAGFDESTHHFDGEHSWRPKCSQCEAMVINGYAAHETGCPNVRRPDDESEDDE